MRLICPNCAAQYEIEDALIPDAGRDVQCSNCGHTWFANKHGAASDLADEAGATTESSDDDTGPPRRRELDENTKRILREEAERETAQRRRAAEAPLEEQTEMGLNPAPRSKPRSEPKGLMDLPDRFPDDAAPTPEARQDDSDAAPKPDTRPDPANDTLPPEPARSAAAIAASSRGDLLPDIDQINSTLTATSDRQGGMKPLNPPEDDKLEDIARPEKSGFSKGFTLVLLITALAIVLYLAAPRIAATLPATEPTLAGYVEAVNTFRTALDGWLISASEAILGATGD